MMEARARRAVMSDVVARNGMLEPRVVHSFDLCCRVSTMVRRLHLRNMCIFMKYANANGC
jgi:hypothetical protein